MDLIPTRATAPTASDRPADPRRSGPPFDEVLAAAAAPSSARRAAAAPAQSATASWPAQAADETSEDAPRGSATAQAVLAALTVARSTVDQARPHAAVPAAALEVATATVEEAAAGSDAAGTDAQLGATARELPRGLTVARAAVAANGAQGTPGGPAFAEPAVASDDLSATEGTTPEAANVTAQPATELALDAPAAEQQHPMIPANTPVPIAATPTVSGSEGDAAAPTAPSAVMTTAGAPEGPAADAPTQLGATAPEATHTGQSATAPEASSASQAPTGPAASATAQTATVPAPPAPVDPTGVELPDVTASAELAPASSSTSSAAAPDATAASALHATAPTVAPTSAPASAPSAATAFVGRLVDAATELQNAPAPREVVLDLRDVLGSDASVSVRLVRGEVHVSVRGDLPGGDLQRELSESLSQRGFDLGSFDRRDRSTAGRGSAGEPGERGRDEHPAPDQGRRPTPPRRPDHADVRHAAGLRL